MGTMSWLTLKASVNIKTHRQCDKGCNKCCFSGYCVIVDGCPGVAIAGVVLVYFHIHSLYKNVAVAYTGMHLYSRHRQTQAALMATDQNG